MLGVCGFAASLAIALGVAAANRLSVLDEAVIIAASVATFFTVTIGTKAVTGREPLIYYHHEIAVLSVGRCGGRAARRAGPRPPRRDGARAR